MYRRELPHRSERLTRQSAEQAARGESSAVSSAHRPPNAWKRAKVRIRVLKTEREADYVPRGTADAAKAIDAGTDPRSDAEDGDDEDDQRRKRLIAPTRNLRPQQKELAFTVYRWIQVDANGDLPALDLLANPFPVVQNQSHEEVQEHENEQKNDQGNEQGNDQDMDQEYKQENEEQHVEQQVQDKERNKDQQTERQTGREDEQQDEQQDDQQNDQQNDQQSELIDAEMKDSETIKESNVVENVTDAADATEAADTADATEEQDQ